MSLNLAEYWVDVREREAELRTEFPSDSVPLCLLANRGKSVTGGAITFVRNEVAARCLVNGTHRLATEIEILDHKARQNVRGREIVAHEERMRGAKRWRGRIA